MTGREGRGREREEERNGEGKGWGADCNLTPLEGRTQSPKQHSCPRGSVVAEGPGRYTCRWFWDSYLRPWTGFGAEKYKWDQIARGPVGVASI